jgi:EmrB/QacA subfamily drug resistance transporter
MTAAANSATSRRAAVLAIILVSYLMLVLDISIVITGLPKIRLSLGYSPAELSWVQSAYTLTFGGLLLLGARAGDILGRRRMFISGLALFTLASLAIGAAQSPAWLIGARAIQGVGAAILAPSTLALLQTNFPEGPVRTRAIAYYGAVAGIGSSFGLVIGGILADWLSWRVGFFINLPIGIALMLGARRLLGESERRSGAFDAIGAVSSTLGMTALVYGMVRSASAGWSDHLTVAALAAGALLLAFFAFNEWRARQPIMPLRLFASRERTGAYAARVLFLGAMMGFWFFATQFLQGVIGYGAFAAGLAFLPLTLPNFAVAIAVPKLTQRLGNGRLLAGGLAVTLIGMAWLSRVSLDSPYLTGVALPMILIGLGQGATLSPLTVAGVAGVQSEDAGAAAGLVNAAHQLGGSLGLGVLVAISATATSGMGGGPETLAHGVASALTAGALMLALALVLVLALIVRPKGSPQPALALEPGVRLTFEGEQS